MNAGFIIEILPQVRKGDSTHGEIPQVPKRPLGVETPSEDKFPAVSFVT